MGSDTPSVQVGISPMMKFDLCAHGSPTVGGKAGLSQINYQHTG